MPRSLTPATTSHSAGFEPPHRSAPDVVALVATRLRRRMLAIAGDRHQMLANFSQLLDRKIGTPGIADQDLAAGGVTALRETKDARAETVIVETIPDQDRV